MSGGAAGPWGALRLPLLRRFLLAGLVSGLGAHVQTVAAGWMMATLTDQVWMVALVQTATSLPILMFALLAGALADVYERRVLLLIAQGIMLAAALILAALSALGLVTPWALLTLTFVLGAGTALHAPCWQASLGDLAPGRYLGDAVALNSLGANLARSTGPALGGFIIAAAGVGAAFLFNALSYIGIILALLSWRRPTAPRSLPPEGLGIAISTGLRFAALSPPVRDGLVRALAFGVFSSALWAMTPLLARDVLGGGPQTYGALMAAFGVGAVSGAAANTLLRRRLSSEAIVRLTTLLFAAGAVGAALAPNLAAALPCLWVAGATWVVAVATFNVHIQSASPRWVVGRAVSIFQMSAFGGMAVGSALFGGAAAYLGVQGVLGLSGALMAASLALGRIMRLRDQNPLELTPAPPESQPDLPAPLDGRSPTLVSIEYRINVQDEARFVELMRRNARARQKAGAQRWRLLRDGGEIGVWVEQYESPNWSEHLRNRIRRSASDREVQLALWALHQGDAPPRVQRLLRVRDIGQGSRP